MKAKELMIGDWVIIDTYPEKVKLIGDTLIKVWNRDNSIDIDDVLPIPLTAEILEKNGFEVQEQGGGRKDVWTGFGLDCEGDIEVEFQHNIPTHLKIDGVFKGEYYISTNIKYVHELQHLLRVCGVEKEMEL